MLAPWFLLDANHGQPEAGNGPEGWLFSIKEMGSTLWKTNMAMEHEPFEDVFPIEDIPARYVSLPLGTLGNLVLARFVGNILSWQDLRNGWIKANPCDVRHQKNLLDAKNHILSREMSPVFACQKVGKGELKQQWFL